MDSKHHVSKTISKRITVDQTGKLAFISTHLNCSRNLEAQSWFLSLESGKKKKPWRDFGNILLRRTLKFYSAIKVF